VVTTQDEGYVFTPAAFQPGYSEECPQPAYHALAARHGLFERPEDGVPVVAKMADIVRLNQSRDVRSTDGQVFDLGGQRPLIPLHLDGAEHTRYRRLLDPLFSPKAVAQYEATLRDLADELIDDFAEAGRVELYSAFCQPLPSRFFVSLLGLPRDDLPVFLDFKESVVRPRGTTPEEQHEYRLAAGSRMYQYLAAELDRRRDEAGPRPDLIGGMLTAEVDGHRLDDDTLIDICYLLVIAGLDTVASSLSLLVAWFARHPAERRRVVEDESLLPAAIEELMRFESPVPLGHRYLAADMDVGGKVYPAGSKVEVVWAAANVDPEAFDDPLSVDFGRSSNRHIAFASGFHRCLGSHLARLELRVGIGQLHRRIPDYGITPGSEVAYTNYSVRAAERLPLSFTAATDRD
jgi:cytochrome P450